MKPEEWSPTDPPYVLVSYGPKGKFHITFEGKEVPGQTEPHTPFKFAVHGRLFKFVPAHKPKRDGTLTMDNVAIPHHADNSRWQNGPARHRVVPGGGIVVPVNFKGPRRRNFGTI